MKTSTYKYQLEKYTNPSSRYTCPGCGRKREFTRYIDVETGRHIHPTVGKCNREDNCGYHLSPKDYFENNGMPDMNYQVKVEVVVKPVSFLPSQAINTNFEGCSLYDFLCSYFAVTDVDRVMMLYRVGSSDRWPKSVVFYQIDRYCRYRTGKIMAYDPQTGKRIKEPYNHIAWVHTEIADYSLKQCFFGEHLLEGSQKPVCIVESEKTALIMAIKEPDYIWLATGGLCNLNKDHIRTFGLRKVVLFPDAGCADKWAEKAKGTDAFVCRDLEQYPTGTDLADVVLGDEKILRKV